MFLFISSDNSGSNSSEDCGIISYLKGALLGLQLTVAGSYLSVQLRARDRVGSRRHGYNQQLQTLVIQQSSLNEEVSQGVAIRWLKKIQQTLRQVHNTVKKIAWIVGEVAREPRLLVALLTNFL